MKLNLKLFVIIVIGFTLSPTILWSQEVDQNKLENEEFATSGNSEEAGNKVEEPVDKPQTVDDLAEDSEHFELNFLHAGSYDVFQEKEADWVLFLDMGFHTANVEEDFTSSVPLPDDYSFFGVEIDIFPSQSKLYYGFSYQQLTSSVKDSLVTIDYALTLFQAIAGYKIIDREISIAPHLGLIFGLDGSAKTKTIASPVTSNTVDFKIGLSYSFGIQTIIKLKYFQIGFDSGYYVISSQEVDGSDLSNNMGGYFRTLIGKAF